MNKLTVFALMGLTNLAMGSGCAVDETIAPVDEPGSVDLPDRKAEGPAADTGHGAPATEPAVDLPPSLPNTPSAPSCGDGAVDETEWCDDGNAIDGDGCSASCFIEHGFTCLDSPSICESLCGDGLQASDEECDDGNVVDGDGCDASCIDEPGGHCGDGIVLEAIEPCDDGNIIEGDGCNSDCAIEFGFTCVVDPELQQSVCTPCEDADGNLIDC